MRRMSRLEGLLSTRGIVALALLAPIPALLLSLAPRARLAPADFTFNNGGEGATLDPHTAPGVPEGRILRAIYEPLVSRQRKSLNPIPGAAESWSTSNGARTYTFLLHEGLKWSNGDPLTAEDFEWSFRRILSPQTGAPFADLLDCVVGARAFRTGAEGDWSTVGIKATDERTLVFDLDEAVSFLDLISMHAFVPVHRGSLEKARREHPSTWRIEWLRPESMVTNGPFVVAERRINDRIRLVRNPNYWDRDAVAFRTIDALAIEHWGTALNMYLTGEIDWLDGTIPPDLLGELVGREDYLTATYLGVYFYRLNVTRPPFDDPDVRRALAAAVDRARIVEHIARGGHTVATTFVPGILRGYRPPHVEALDLDAAHALMTRAGYYGPTPKPLRPIEIHFNNSELHRDIAEYVARGWSETFGIQVSLAPQDKKTYIDTQSNLDYDVSRSSWIGDYVDPASFLDIWVTGGRNNRTGWSNPEYDDLIERAHKAQRYRDRYALYQEAEAILLDEAPVIPIFHYASQNLVNPRLGGFETNILNEHFAKDWYWRDDRELELQRAQFGSRTRRVPAPGPHKGRYSAAQRAARAGGGDGEAEQR